MSKKSRKNSNHWRNAKLCVYTLSLLTVESALAADSLEQRLQNFQANPRFNQRPLYCEFLEKDDD